MAEPELKPHLLTPNPLSFILQNDALSMVGVQKLFDGQVDERMGE